MGSMRTAVHSQWKSAPPTFCLFAQIYCWYTWALLTSPNRRHIFVTLWLLGTVLQHVRSKTEFQFWGRSWWLGSVVYVSVSRGGGMYSEGNFVQLEYDFVICTISTKLTKFSTFSTYWFSMAYSLWCEQVGYRKGCSAAVYIFYRWETGYPLL